MSDVYCREAAGHLPVHPDDVLTREVHSRAEKWQLAGAGMAVAREEGRKLNEWGSDDLQESLARLVRVNVRL